MRDNKGRFIKGHKTGFEKYLKLGQGWNNGIESKSNGVLENWVRKNGAWNKGKNKLNEPSLSKMGFKKGHKINVGRICSVETRVKISESNKNKELSTSKLKQLRKNGLRGLLKQQSSKEPTSIEKKVYDYLVLKGIIFEKQKLINGKFIVDAYIPSLNLVIEADGSYWHGLDRVVKKDRAENAYLKKCGFNMIRLTEEEINSEKFKERMVF